jgi:hypothetical protein
MCCRQLCKQSSTLNFDLCPCVTQSCLAHNAIQVSAFLYRHTWPTQFDLTHLWGIKKKKFRNASCFPIWEWMPNETKLAEEYCWAITHALGGHPAADQISGCGSLCFNWTSLYVRINTYVCVCMYTHTHTYIYTHTHTYIHTHTLYSNLCQTFRNVTVILRK